MVKTLKSALWKLRLFFPHVLKMSIFVFILLRPFLKVQLSLWGIFIRSLVPFLCSRNHLSAFSSHISFKHDRFFYVFIPFASFFLFHIWRIVIEGHFLHGSFVFLISNHPMCWAAIVKKMFIFTIIVADGLNICILLTPAVCLPPHHHFIRLPMSRGNIKAGNHHQMGFAEVDSGLQFVCHALQSF